MYIYIYMYACVDIYTYMTVLYHQKGSQIDLNFVAIVLNQYILTATRKKLLEQVSTKFVQNHKIKK